MTSASIASLFANSNSGSSCPGPPPQPSSLAMTKRQQPGALLTSAPEKSVPKSTARTIPAFLTKLFTMVNDPDTDHLIKWAEPLGDSFFVISSERFGRELLPKYFKHSNFGSFVRQLNMYGFHKVPHLNQGVLQCDLPETEMIEFSNPHFQRGQPDMLCFIQRKKSAHDSSAAPGNAEPTDSAGTAAPPSVANFDLQSIIADIATIRKHQALLSSDLKTLQSSNGHLWQEAIASRERTKRCQDTISKILAFLAQVFGGKISGINNPSRGNSETRTARDGDFYRTADTGVESLLDEVNSIPRRDNHRTRTGETRDNHNISFNPSAAGLSVLNRPRQPRLMLEDTQRFLERSADKSPEIMVSNSTPNDDKVTLSDLFFGPESRETLNGLSSPGIFSQPLSEKGGASNNHEKPVGTDPELLSPTESCTRSNGSSRDPTLDPDLPPSRPGSAKSDRDSAKEGLSDKASNEAIFQAIFNDNSSNAGYNVSDELFPKINWLEIFNGNDPNTFDCSTSSSHQPPQSLRPSSPLRITDGLDSMNQPSPLPNPSLPSHELSPRTKTVFDLQSQSEDIDSAKAEVDSLEAVIERLVGSLPQAMKETTIESSGDGGNPLNLNDSVSGLGAPGSKDSNLADPQGLCTDAFIENLALPNLTPSTSGSQIPTLPVNRFPDAGLASNGNAASISPLSEDRCDSLDLERILDEWTSEDVHSLASPAPIAPKSINPANFNAPFSASSTSSALPDSNNNLIQTEEDQPPSAFDLNDDDQLRRIMSKKPVGSLNGSRRIPFSVPNGGSLSSEATQPITAQFPVIGTRVASLGSPQPSPPKKRPVDETRQVVRNKKSKTAT